MENHFRRDKRVNLANRFKKLDMFGQPVQLNLQGQQHVNTVSGSCLSIILLFMMAAYAATRFSFLLQRRNPNISTVALNSYYTGNDAFSFEKNGFNIAFGVEDYINRDGKSNPSIVNWAPLIYYYPGDGTWEEKFLKYHRCTDEDFDKRFFEIEPSFVPTMTRIRKVKSLFCLDPEEEQDIPLAVQGENDKQTSKILDLIFQHCTDERKPSPKIVCNKNQTKAQ